MELENQTRYPALLFRGAIDDERFCASVLARITYELTPGGLAEAEEQVWEVSAGPWQGPHGGAMESDEVFYKGGVDVFVFGAAQPSPNDPARGRVTVAVGNAARHDIDVFGDRVWVENAGQLRPGPPQPFESIPLDLLHAYGGSDQWDELAVPFPDNPVGKGYYLERDRAVGKFLPNLESPKHPIQNWEDQPEPVATCTAPPSFGPRLRRFVEIDEATGAVRRLDPKFFNAALPGMIFPAANPGDGVEVNGVDPQGTIRFQIPDPGLRIQLAFDGERIEAIPQVDQIGIESGQQRAFIAWRYPFRYRMVPLQRRSCALVQ